MGEGDGILFRERVLYTRRKGFQNKIEEQKKAGIQKRQLYKGKNFLAVQFVHFDMCTFN